MSDFRELYQEMILDHNRSPRNFREMPDANRDSEGFNPLCGDHIHLYVRRSDEGVMEEIAFQGTGCAISKASASLMTSLVKGQRQEETEALLRRLAGRRTTQRSRAWVRLPPRTNHSNCGTLSVNNQ